MKIVLTSFGKKYGTPQADIVLDVRCLENPFWVPALKERSGLDAAVREYIFSNPQSMDYLNKLSQFLKLHTALAAGRACEKMQIAIGCTGGRHRSVAVAEFLAAELSDFEIEVVHRDIGKG